MKESLNKAIQEEPQRFIDHAFKDNPNIKDLEDFRNALDNSFNTERGERAKNHFDMETYADLFENPECRSRIEDNIGKKESDKLYGEVKRGEFELIQDGTSKFISTPKTFKVGKYTRKGNPVKPYNKGYKRWNNAEKKFLQVRKAKKISNKEIIYQYNEHFKENQRSSSSLKTKIYRI